MFPGGLLCRKSHIKGRQASRTMGCLEAWMAEQSRGYEWSCCVATKDYCSFRCWLEAQCFSFFFDRDKSAVLVWSALSLFWWRNFWGLDLAGLWQGQLPFLYCLAVSSIEPFSLRPARGLWFFSQCTHRRFMDETPPFKQLVDQHVQVVREQGQDALYDY